MSLVAISQQPFQNSSLEELNKILSSEPIKNFLGSEKKPISEIGKKNINYKVEGALEQSIVHLRAFLANKDAQQINPENLKFNLEKMTTILRKLQTTQTCPEHVINRLANELYDIKKLANSPVAPTTPVNEIKEQINYLKELITIKKNKQPLPSVEVMRQYGLSEAAIEVLQSKKFVPYDESFCAQLPINLHCRGSAHNACITNATDEFGNMWEIAQQKMTEIELLAFGVRQVEMDIAINRRTKEDKKSPIEDEGRIMICHGNYNRDEVQKKGHYESFHSKLWEVTQWLEASPTETLIINLDCLRDKHLTAEQINNELATFSDFIYNPEDLSAFRKAKGNPEAWPTPAEMGQKRLIVMYPEKLLGGKPGKVKGDQDTQKTENREYAQQTHTYHRLTFDQDTITDTTIPGLSTGVKEKIRGSGDKANQKSFLGIIKGIFKKKKEKEVALDDNTNEKPLFMLYHNSAFPFPGTLSRYAYIVLRTLFIKPVNFIFGTHMPDLDNEKLIIPDNSTAAIFKRVAECENEKHHQTTSIHMDDFHTAVADGFNGPLNALNEARLLQFQQRRSRQNRFR